MKSAPLLVLLTLGAIATFVYLSRAVSDASSNGGITAVVDASKPPEIFSEQQLTQYAELKFSEIYRQPAGPKGLDFTDKAARMVGQKVRLQGYMVRYPHPDPKLFLFNSTPMFLDYREYGLADSLPPEAVHVITTVPDGKAYSYYKQEMILLGTIEYGSAVEMDGRVSHIRLKLEAALDAKTRSKLSLEASLAMQRERLFNAERVQERKSS